MVEEMDQNYKGYFDSPIGTITIISDGTSLSSILFPNGEIITEANPDGIVKDCIIQLKEYFLGTRKSFNLPLNPKGTDFQKKVWDIVISIPFGGTVSYGAIATSLGNPKLNRAVGLANGANPIPIVIPCHRVIGSNGSLTGYAGGLEVKKILLNHEQDFYTAAVGQLKLF